MPKKLKVWLGFFGWGKWGRRAHFSGDADGMGGKMEDVYLFSRSNERTQQHSSGKRKLQISSKPKNDVLPQVPIFETIVFRKRRETVVGPEEDGTSPTTITTRKQRLEAAVTEDPNKIEGQKPVSEATKKSSSVSVL